MAPMTFARVQDSRNLIIFKDHLLRYIILYFTRSAYIASRLDYEEKFLALHRRITGSRSSKRRYRNISSLASLIWGFIIDTKMVMGQRSVSRLSWLQEFCQSLLKP